DGARGRGDDAGGGEAADDRRGGALLQRPRGQGLCRGRPADGETLMGLPELIQRRGAVHLADEHADHPSLDPPRAVLELVPESVARENQIIPLALDGETLTVAAADSGNLLVADKLSFILNKKVRLVRYPADAIRDAIRRH